MLQEIVVRGKVAFFYWRPRLLRFSLLQNGGTVMMEHPTCHKSLPSFNLLQRVHLSLTQFNYPCKYPLEVSIDPFLHRRVRCPRSHKDIVRKLRMEWGLLKFWILCLNCTSMLLCAQTPAFKDGSFTGESTTLSSLPNSTMPSAIRLQHIGSSDLPLANLRWQCCCWRCNSPFTVSLSRRELEAISRAG